MKIEKKLKRKTVKKEKETFKQKDEGKAEQKTSKKERRG